MAYAEVWCGFSAVLREKEREREPFNSIEILFSHLPFHVLLPSFSSDKSE
jgi:hypothetical protein